MTNIAVPCPPSLRAYREHLREFLSIMLRKLDMNSHKNTPTKRSVTAIVGAVLGELDEFLQQHAFDRHSENTLIELADGANLLFMAFVALRSEGVKTEKEKLIDEFLDIRPQEGKVYCKKARAGSQYKVGEEIKGSNRNGYVDIKLQRYRNGGSSSAVPRSHLIWWKAYGSWPVGVLDHNNRKKNDDRIGNLTDASFSENSCNTALGEFGRYVTQYRPKGREHLANWGKYVFQKRWDGVNVRCAYYDTPEEAATRGAFDWAAKVKKAEKERLNA